MRKHNIITYININYFIFIDCCCNDSKILLQDATIEMRKISKDQSDLKIYVTKLYKQNDLIINELAKLTVELKQLNRKWSRTYGGLEMALPKSIPLSSMKDLMELEEWILETSSNAKDMVGIIGIVLHHKM